MPIEVTAYKCQYCGAKFYRLTKYAVEQHEKWCYSRPENSPKCWEGCVHYEGFNRDSINAGGSELIQREGHVCSFDDEKYMASKKMVVRGTDKDMPQMPIGECVNYDCGFNFDQTDIDFS